MKPDQLLAHFDRIADSPDALSRLRRFVHDLAVQGKLVERALTDEPASELLKRIQTEKARMMKEGKIGKHQRSLQIREEELPFDAPPGWGWARLATISRRIHYGFTASANKFFNDVRLLRITDIQNNSVDWSSVPGCEISPREVEQYKLEEGDILIARTGGTIGKSFLVKHIPVVAVFASYLIRVQGSPDVNDEYLKLFLDSSVYWKQLQEAARGGGQPNVNAQTLGMMMVPIPPFNEQYRIVNKVEELMVLCDQLEAAQSEQERRRNQLATATLDRLRTDAGASDFRDYSRFYVSHLEFFTMHPRHIIALRKTIMNLAVRGKLVEQNSDDEPASELLKRIQTEKARLVRNGEIRKLNLQPRVDPKKVPYRAPKHWTYVRLGDVIHLVSGQHLQLGEYSDQPQSGVPYITGPADFGPDGLTISRYAIIKKAVAKKGQILLTVKGAGVGKTAICDLPEVAISRQLMAMAAIEWSQRFLLIITHLLAEMLKESTRSLIPGISREDVNQFVFALPPLAEQLRIVAKVEDLLILCDRLEAQLIAGQTQSRNFVEAVLNQVLGIVSFKPTEQRHRVPKRGVESLSPQQAISREDLQFMNTNPARTVGEVVDRLTALGGTASPERLLNVAGLGDDVDLFFVLLREGRDLGLLDVPTGHNQVIGLSSVTTGSN